MGSQHQDCDVPLENLIVIVCVEEPGSGSMAVWFDVGVHTDRPETELVERW